MSSISSSGLAGDPDLPRRDDLLDEAFVAELVELHLARSDRFRVEACERVRARYRVGRDVGAVHRVRVDGEWFTVAARMFCARQSESARARTLRPAASTGRLAPVAHVAALDTVLSTFPFDVGLPHLTAATAAPATFSDDSLPAIAVLRPIVYSPERFAIWACLDENNTPVAVARAGLHADIERGFQTVFRLWQALAESADAAVPRPIAWHSDVDVALVEAVAGRPVPVVGPHAIADHQLLGAALAALHDSRVAGLPRFARFDDDRLRRAGLLLACVRPDVGADASALVRELVDRRPPAAPRNVVLHANLDPKHLLVGDDMLTFADVEDVAYGPADADFGIIAARLRSLVVAGVLTPIAAAALSDAIDEGYAALRPLPRHDARRWSTAAAMLTDVCLGTVKRVSREGLLQLPALAADARAVLIG